ncbi:hypothetical protein [Marinobacter salarius]|uniref:hypothetical protein n=1 Tax=Marinobacter salarius TaxID=1420917 RepID=UPI00125EE463|nr:hypothetical protein [Marinobacter salarius]
MEWSEKHKLADYIRAPKEPGIYFVGIHKPGFLHDGDEFLGENMPHEFIPKYVGISKRSVRSRLYAHAKGRGNRHIKSFIARHGIEDLEYVYHVSKGTEVEHHFLTHTIDQFVWNIRQSEEGAWRKLLRSL